MGNEVLDDLFTLNVDRVSIETFTADHSLTCGGKQRQGAQTSQPGENHIKRQ